MEILVTVETELFERREVRPHFINPCCFGEDFAGWLIGAIAPTTPSSNFPNLFKRISLNVPLTIGT